MTHGCKVVKSNGLVIIGIQITLNGSTFLAGFFCRHDFESRIGYPFELNGKTFQHVQTDLFITVCLFIKLLKDRVEIKKEIFIFLSAVKNLKVLMIMKGKADSVNPYRKIA